MAMLFRFAMRLHKGLIGQWDEAFHRHWDQAVRNSSCLRAAILRALKVEVGYLEGFDSLAILWDIAAFYDSIRLCDLVRLGLERSFPPLLLRLSLFGHCGPRAFKERQFIGPWLQVTDLSIVAGCVSSVSHTRNLLYNILEDMHRAYQPVQITTWVDDCPQVHVGDLAILENHAPEAAIHFATLLSKRGFAISPKTTIISSNTSTAKVVQHKLKAKNISVRVSDNGRDVGVDYAGGSRRRITLQATRLGKARAGGRVLQKMIKTCQNFKKLVFTGVRTRLYGFPIQGAAPTTVAHARSAVCHPLGLRKPGGCLTVGLALAGMSHKDPALTMPLENVLEFALGHASSSHKLSTARVWQEKAVDLAGKGRWAKVHGPMASAAATLLDFEWEIPSIDLWISPDAVHWDIDFADQNLEGMLREVVGHYMQMAIWHKAKACDSGEIPDLTEVRALMKRGKAANDHRSVYWLDAVVQGGADTSFSRYAIFEEGLVKCSCCGEIVEDSIWQHLCYFCQAQLDDSNLQDPEVVSRGQDDLGNGTRYSLWLRGLRPLDMPDPLTADYMFTNSWGQCRLDVEGLILGSDGTGGEHARDPRSRRCCFGAAVIKVAAHQFTLVGTAYGTVCGKQTVPRSEMRGLLHMLHYTKGDAIIVIDNKQVVDTFSKGLRARPKYNGLLWSAIFKAAKLRVAHGFGKLTALWTRSHLSFDVAVAHGTDPFVWTINHIADHVADRAAASSQLPEENIMLRADASSLVFRILKRQVKIAVKLSSVDGSRFTKPPVDPKAFNKVKLASQWAREAGHILNASGRCVSCGLLCVGSRKSIAYLEACLHLPCLGSTNSGDLKLHHVPKVGSDWWLCHGLQVHCSHTIASHFSLKVHFCTRCGHFGPPGGKSPGLKNRCKPPSKTGKQALRNIHKSRWPAYKGKTKKKVLTSSRPCLTRFAKLFKDRRIRAALGSSIVPSLNSFSATSESSLNSCATPSGITQGGTAGKTFGHQKTFGPACEHA